MKKISILLSLFAVLAVNTAFATSEPVSRRVLESFKSTFKTAQDVSWQSSNKYYRASFSMNDQRIYAYYDGDGYLISVARYISSLQLPVNLFADLKNEYENYWISDLFEESNSDGIHYYVTLENADTRIVLVSSNGGSWNNYSKTKKV